MHPEDTQSDEKDRCEPPADREPFSASGSLSFCRLRTASGSLRLVAEPHAVHDTWALVRSRSLAACVRDSVPVTMRETSQMGGKTHAAPPDHRPPAPLACDAPRPGVQVGTATSRRRRWRPRRTFKGVMRWRME